MQLSEITIIDGNNPKWRSQSELLIPLLGVSKNKNFFPLHFLLVVLPKIGGKLVLIGTVDSPVAVGLLFPRKVSVGPASIGGQTSSSPKLYTLRLHMIDTTSRHDQEKILQKINDTLGPQSKAVLYRFSGYTFRPSAQQIGTFDNRPLTIGRPSEEEAERARSIHQQIWRAQYDELYPVDIHSYEFGLATDLVIRVGDEIAGFLIGFYKNDGGSLPASWLEQVDGAWRIESQVMGVLPQYRGQSFGVLLKRAQGELAAKDRISIVNWTADPLQFPNAVLNFGKLGAVSFGFYPDLYPFRNELNRVPASRFELTWLVQTDRVRSRPLVDKKTQLIDIGAEGISKVNDGPNQIVQQPQSEQIAIEVPSNWTAIQRENAAEAQLWRKGLDDIFNKVIGISEECYAITGVGVDGNRCYLVGERARAELWSKLVQ